MTRLKLRSLPVQLLALYLCVGLVRVSVGAPTDPMSTSVSVPVLNDEKPKTNEIGSGDASVATQTGALSYTFPIQVPPGRLNAAPSLALTYNSQGTLYGGIAAGWELSLPSIQRDLSDGRLYEDYLGHFGSKPPKYVSSLAGSHRLIPVSEPALPDVAQTYRAQFDTSFARYEQLTAAGQWRIRQMDGGVLEFGDPSHVSSGFADTDVALLTKTVDASGNEVRYFWDAHYDGYAEPVDYTIDRIEYSFNPGAGYHEAHARVLFDYDFPTSCEATTLPIGARLDMRSGRRRHHGSRRLNEIRTEVVYTPGVYRIARRITLNYYNGSEPGTVNSESCSARHAPIRLLRSIEQRGHLADDPVGTAVPPTEFSYGPLEREFLAKSIPFDDGASPNPHSLGWGKRITTNSSLFPTVEQMYFDMDGDGLVDRLRMDADPPTGDPCRVYWQRNDGTGFASVTATSFDLPTMRWQSGGGPTGSENCSLVGQLTMAQTMPPAGVGECQQPQGSYLVYRFLRIGHPENGDDLLPDLVAALHYDPNFYDPAIDGAAMGLPEPQCGGNPPPPACPDVEPDCINDAWTCDQTGCTADWPTVATCIQNAPPIPCDDIMEFRGTCNHFNPDGTKAPCESTPGDPPPSCAPREPHQDCGRYIWYVWDNIGNGEFDLANPPRIVYSPVPLESQQPSGMGAAQQGFSSSEHAIIDINGDGHLDAIALEGRPDELGEDPGNTWWWVFLGDGFGNFEMADNGGPYAWPVPEYARPSTTATGAASEYSSYGDRTANSNSSLIDVNGDGAVDLVWRSREPGHGLDVYINDGTGFVPWAAPSTSYTWGTPFVWMSKSAIAITSYVGSTSIVDEGQRTDIVRPVDFDADGRVDMLYPGASSGTRLIFNQGDRTGGSADTLTSVEAVALERAVKAGDNEDDGSPYDGNIWRASTDCLDLDGDGLCELIDFRDPNAPEVRGEWPNRDPMRLLTQIDNGRGGITTVEYAAHANSPTVTQTPATGNVIGSTTWVVAGLTYEDPWNDPSTTTYSYENPVVTRSWLNDYAFRGFERTVAVSPRGSATADTFGYDPDWSGRKIKTVVYRTTSANESADPVASVSETTWNDYQTFSNAITTYHADETRSWVCRPGQTVAACQSSEPQRRETTTWDTVPGASGVIAALETVVGSGPVPGVGDRHTTTSFLPRDTLAAYQILPEIVERREHTVFGTLVRFGWEKTTYDVFARPILHDVELNNAGEIARRETRFTAAGNVEKVIAPRHEGTEVGTDLAYDIYEVFRDYEKNAAGHERWFGSDRGTGVETDVMGPHFIDCGFGSIVYQTSRTTIDGLGRVEKVEQTTDRDMNACGYEFPTTLTIDYFDHELPNRVETKTAIDADAGLWAVDDETFDGAGRILERRALTERGLAIATYAYEHGDLVSFSVPNPANDAGTVTYSYSYDELGRATDITLPDVPGSTSVGVHYAYDGLFTTVSDTTGDGSGGWTKTEVDVFGRLRNVTEPHEVFGDVITSYFYDANDNLSTFMDGNLYYSHFEHDYASRRTAIVRNAGPDERRWDYVYDKHGNVTEVHSPVPPGEDATDYVTYMTYDALDRLDSKTPAARDLTPAEIAEFAVGPVTYDYDDASAQAIGRLRQVTLPFGEVSFQYDTRGLVVGETRSFSIEHPATTTTIADTKVLSTTYNTAGAAVQFVYPDRTVVDTAYDLRGLPDTVSATLPSGTSVLADNTRNRAGLVTRRDTDHGQHREVVYDERGRPIDDEVWDDDNQVCNRQGICWNSPRLRGFWTPTYYDTGDVETVQSNAGTFSYAYTARRELKSATGPSSYSGEFRHDRNGRLLHADVSWTPTSLTWGSGSWSHPLALNRDVAYDYDAAVSPDPDAVARLVNPDSTDYASFEYDAQSNVTRRTLPDIEWNLRYDGFDRLRRVSRGTVPAERHFYDHAEQRMLVVNSDHVRFYFGPYEAEYDSASGAERPTEAKSHMALGGQSVAQVVGGDDLSLTYHAGRGDMLLALNDTGLVLVDLTYGPWGEIVRHVGDKAELSHHKRLFNDKVHDDTGLTYYGYRYYDPVTLQWNRSDPLYRFVPDIAYDEPRRLNLYAFSLNNPMRYRDPDGLDGGLFTPIEQVARGEATGTIGGDLIEMLRPDEYDIAALSSSALDGPLPVADAAAAAFIITRRVGKAIDGAKMAAKVSDARKLEKARAAEFFDEALEVGSGKKAAGIQENAAKGKAFESKVAAEMEADGWTVGREVTLETPGGARTRMDIVGTKDGVTRCVECKSSATAPLTKSQKAAHPEIGTAGATVKGKGKPAAPGGTELPPTRVEVRRPE